MTALTTRIVIQVTIKGVINEEIDKQSASSQIGESYDCCLENER